MDTRYLCRILGGFSSTTGQRTIVITWLLLVTHGGKADGNSVLHCEPWNLTLNSFNQTILLTWEDDPSCSAVHGTLVYELVVLIADRLEHHDEVTVTPEQAGETHLWNWTSHLSLEHAAHSVKISPRYKNHKGSWKLQRTLQVLTGKSNLEAIFPEDEVFNVGSTVTFYCNVPAGTRLNRMHVDGYNDAETRTAIINNQTYALLTVLLDRPTTDSCANVYCYTVQYSEATCVYVDYPPADKNLQCETRDLKMAECRWTVGNNADVAKTRKTYWLQGRECKNGYEGRCSIEIPVNATETKWTLVVKNPLGKVELTDVADMTKRVHMVAPDKVEVSHVNARDVSLTWKWSKQHYNNLNITCQVIVSSGETRVISENVGDFAVLNNLIPNWTYNATVRCAAANHLWKWGDWSPRVSFHTKGDVPDPLDVWMQMKDNQVIITWKMPLANQSHGNILDYTVTWAKIPETGQKEHTTVTHREQNVRLSLDTSEQYTVTVTARNSNGSSSPSTITILPWNPDRIRVNTFRINGSNGGFNLKWSASPHATCGYIVDWCPTSGNCTVEWIKVPRYENKSRILSKNLKKGLRYTLSIYACTEWAPLLLERREGYVQEERIKDNLFGDLKLKQQDYDVEVSWDPIRLTEQPAFIQGYILYWSNNNNNKSSFSVRTDNPEATSLTARQLEIASYNFTVKALTAVGQCGTTLRLATLDSLSDELIMVIIISLAIVSCLLLLFTILCYRHWACIKQKVYPPIPKPVLMDKWLTSPGERTCRPLYVDPFPHSEADIMDVPELHCKASAPVNSCVSHKTVPFVNTQTPEGYYNQPLKKCTPPSWSALPPSSFTSVFPNLSYNLIMQSGSHQSSSELRLQEGSSLESSSDGYQPQTLFTQTQNNPDATISCVSTYILLPHSPSK